MVTHRSIEQSISIAVNITRGVGVFVATTSIRTPVPTHRSTPQKVKHADKKISRAATHTPPVLESFSESVWLNNRLSRKGNKKEIPPHQGRVCGCYYLSLSKFLFIFPFFFFLSF